MKFLSLQFAIAWLFFLSVPGNVLTQATTFHVINKCPFTIWPATAPNKGHPVIANGGFHLPPGRGRKFQAPEDWSGRFWARTNCTFGPQNHKFACETGDCNCNLECNGSIGQPPATLIEFALNENKPDFYDVSIVDGYNLPVQVFSNSADRKCNIGGCVKDLKSTCPLELQVLNGHGDVVACKSACLAFDLDRFCCRNEFFGPDKCKASVYSKVFKDACPCYVSYAFDTSGSVVSCVADEYVIAFCPDKWGNMSLYLDDE